MEIAPNGITIALDEEGKITGDAYVEFASADIASQAMNKHKEKIGHRLGGGFDWVWEPPFMVVGYSMKLIVRFFSKLNGEGNKHLNINELFYKCENHTGICLYSMKVY